MPRLHYFGIFSFSLLTKRKWWSSIIRDAMIGYSSAMKPMIDMLPESPAPDLREPGETGSPDSADYESLGILKCVSAVCSILSSPKRGYEKCFRMAAAERWPADAEIDLVCEDIQLLVRAVV